MLTPERVAAYLRERHGAQVEVLELASLASQPQAAPGDGDRELKTYGYGHPILVRYRREGAEQRAVLRTMAANPFGHEHRADRAAGLIANFDSFNDLPNHVRALDVGAIAPDGSLVSLGEGEEFFLLTEYVPGQLYAEDLKRLRATGRLEALDVARAQRLAAYLASIHAARRDDPALYRRHLRDVFGGGEGIAGLTDSYPPDFALAPADRLEAIERACVVWRWRLKEHPERLARIHGDFHPFNVLFDTGTSLYLLDRSRGPWGEPADDVGAMSINYLFFSLQRSGAMAEPFCQLWDGFWNTYLAASGDCGVLRCVQPFFAWRALVLASPLWYQVPDSVRSTLLRFAERVLQTDVFEPARVAHYIE